MSFLFPLYLFASAAAAVPIVLHLLRREPEPRVKFAAVRFLRKAPVERTEKRRLRELVLLALRIAALILLAAAFARPFFASSGSVDSAGVSIIALDTSASLSAPGAFERAKQLARDAVDRVPSGDLIGVVTFSDVATLVARPSASRAGARSAIDAATAGFGATRYRGALGVAAQAFGDRRGTVVVITDLQENGWDKGDRASVPESARIEVADAGPLPPNLTVTALRSNGNRLVASVRNTGDAQREAHARLTLDDRPAGEAVVAIGPRASADLEFSVAPNALTAAVSIDDPEGIQADNTRYVVLDAANRPTVLVVTPTGDLEREAFYVQQALLAGAIDRRGDRVAGVSGAQLSTWDPARVSAYTAVLLLSTRGLERRGREALATFARSGGGVLIAAGPEVDGDLVADVLGVDARLQIVLGNERQVERALTPADVRHPVFRVFESGVSALGLVKFHRAGRIEGVGCQTIARFTTGAPALLECLVGDGRGLVLASDLGGQWNDFPRHAAFVPFLHETVRYLAGGRSRAGEYLVGDVPAGVPARPGFAFLPGTAGASPRDSRRIAVNVDPRESEPARISAEEFRNVVTRLKSVGRSEGLGEAHDREDRQHLWQYILALMIGTLAVEGLIAGRTA